MYLKDDIKTDLQIYLSKIGMAYNITSENIDKFIHCIEGLESEDAMPLEGDVQIIEIPDDVAHSFSTIMKNIRNEVFFNSLFIITTSFVESSLTELCRILHPYLSIPCINSYQQYRNGLGIEKSKNYLKEYLQIDISQSKYWSSMQVNLKIRNLIVHNSGNITKDYSKNIDEQDDYKTLKTNDNLTITESGYLFINSSDFIRDVLKMEGEVLKSILMEVKEKLQLD